MLLQIEKDMGETKSISNRTRIIAMMIQHIHIIRRSNQLYDRKTTRRTSSMKYIITKYILKGKLLMKKSIIGVFTYLTHNGFITKFTSKIQGKFMVIVQYKMVFPGEYIRNQEIEYFGVLVECREVM